MSSLVRVGNAGDLEGVIGLAVDRGGMTGQRTGVRKSQVGGKTAEIIGIHRIHTPCPVSAKDTDIEPRGRPANRAFPTQTCDNKPECLGCRTKKDRCLGWVDFGLNPDIRNGRCLGSRPPYSTVRSDSLSVPLSSFGAAPGSFCRPAESR